MRTAFYVVEGFLIRSDQTSACAAFDCHVTDSHTAFHRQIADRFAAIFDDVASAASGASCADHSQSDVFRGHTRHQFASDFHFHVLRLLLDERLGRQNVLNFGRADAVCQCAERTVGCSVAVAANNSHARKRPALLWANDVHDALTNVGHGVVVDTKFFGVLVERSNLNTAVFGHGRGISTVQSGRNVVIRNSDGLFRSPHFATSHTQTFECLRRGHFVNEVAIDIQKTSAVFGLLDDVCVPDFVIERLGRHGSYLWKC